jgi:hypothetical protein
MADYNGEVVDEDMDVQWLWSKPSMQRRGLLMQEEAKTS